MVSTEQPTERVFISVIIPTFNRKASLRRTLESLNQQTYPLDCFEVIIVDDGVRVGCRAAIHRNCRFYRPNCVSIDAHTVINRDVLLDGHSGLTIGSNVSISEGCMLLTPEHAPNSPTFANRGAATRIGDRAFLGARAIILPGLTIGDGAVVAAGAVVAKDAPSFAIVAGQPARQIGERMRDMAYTLNYGKFLG